MVSGSDRACEKWMADYDIPGTDEFGLHHFYRAMARLGEELDAADDGQQHATPYAPRCVKDQIEEALFERRRDLFSELSIVFMEPRPSASPARAGRRSASAATPRTTARI
jgi:hypothetical protein